MKGEEPDELPSFCEFSDAMRAGVETCANCGLHLSDPRHDEQRYNIDGSPRADAQLKQSEAQP